MGGDVAQTSNFVLRTVDRVWGAVHGLERESRRLVRDLEGRRTSLEKQLRTRQRRVTKQAEREVARLRTQVYRVPLVRGAFDLGWQAARGVEQAVSTIVAPLPLASKSEFAKMDRKVNQLNRKLSLMSRKVNELERRRPTRKRARR